MTPWRAQPVFHAALDEEQAQGSRNRSSAQNIIFHRVIQTRRSSMELHMPCTAKK